MTNAEQVMLETKIVGGGDTPRDSGTYSEERQTVLVGVADPTGRKSIARALVEGKREIVAVGDGVSMIDFMADALLYGRMECCPTLIVADAILPGCTGLSILEGLREFCGDLPVVILISDDADEGLRRHAWALGAVGVFVGPCDPQQLKAYCEMLLESAETHHPEDARTQVGREHSTSREEGHVTASSGGDLDYETGAQHHG